MGRRRRRTDALAAGGASSLRSGGGIEAFGGLLGTTQCLKVKLVYNDMMIAVMVALWLTEGPWLRCCVEVAGRS